ncbi:MAG: nucleoside diphosphate kinase [Candidatus Binatia bacterium]|nr:MAG: nucleoside diphosphate kinase [Candidatus Binatia bacterium]
MVERTLGIVKPDAVARNLVGEVLRRAEQAGLRIVGLKFLRLTPSDAARFYVVHKDKPFYRSLVGFMSEGPVLVFVLEGENAIEKWREVMGPTDPAKAAPGTVRGDFGTDIERNAVHGSDGPDTARWEIAFFFSQYELGR